MKRKEQIATVPVTQTPMVSVAIEPLALSLVDAARVTGAPAWTLNEAVWRGELPAKWCGRQRVILVSDLRNWIASLDTVVPKTPPSIAAREKKTLEARA